MAMVDLVKSIYKDLGGEDDDDERKLLSAQGIAQEVLAGMVESISSSAPVVGNDVSAIIGARLRHAYKQKGMEAMLDRRVGTGNILGQFFQDANTMVRFGSRLNDYEEAILTATSPSARRAAIHRRKVAVRKAIEAGIRWASEGSGVPMSSLMNMIPYEYSPLREENLDKQGFTW
jgi:hypothetical protein